MTLLMTLRPAGTWRAETHTRPLPSQHVNLNGEDTRICAESSYTTPLREYRVAVALGLTPPLSLIFYKIFITCANEI